MKRISYQRSCGKDFFVQVSHPWSEETERLAAREAYQGHYTVTEETGEAAAPSRLDILEAQVAYTAMMTDTLMEV